MSEIPEGLVSWYESLYHPRVKVGADQNVFNFFIPGTNLEYRMDKADKAITPLFDDPGSMKMVHLMFRDLVNRCYNKTRCTRVYLCASEQDEKYGRVGQ